MKTSIAIIGGGFAGTSLIRQMIERTQSIEIILFNVSNQISKGIAYDCKQDSSLLNVMTSKMSAFPDNPNHFLDWCMNQSNYSNDSKEIVANSFLPRKIYGNYLAEIWEETMQIAELKGIKITVIEQKVIELKCSNSKVELKTLFDKFICDKCILATGNETPGNPKKVPLEIIQNQNYFENPWKIEFEKINKNLPVLIIGNGLTMVDTVLNLRENNFQQTITSISPNGFNILPHRNFNFKYESSLSKIETPITLLEVIHLFNLEVKKLKKFGVSPEPIIDAFRPNVQKVWQQFSIQEKEKFMNRLRHIWGVARHRIPFVSYDKILKEQINNSLSILAGNIHECKVSNDSFEVEIFNKRLNKLENQTFGAIINCTGPETNVSKTKNELLIQLKADGIIVQDKLNLGLRINTKNFRTINNSNTENNQLYAIGSLLKGELWESTAVNELKNQAKDLAEQLTNELLKT